VGKTYSAKIANLDFSKGEASAKVINRWCSDQTNGMIKKVIDKTDPTMLCYLLNALYFKSQWTEKFNKSNTAEETFTDEAGNKSTVKMMKQNESFSYQHNDVFKIVRMPYGNGAFSMVALLPQEGKTIADALDEIKESGWRETLRSMVHCDVDLWLPRFETKYHINLNDILSDMGMPTSFTNSADFKAISDYALKLSFVQQDAVIKVDEEGTEAAAVTYIGKRLTITELDRHVMTCTRSQRIHQDQRRLELNAGIDSDKQCEMCISSISASKNRICTERASTARQNGALVSKPAGNGHCGCLLHVDDVRPWAHHVGLDEVQGVCVVWIGYTDKILDGIIC
jgi:hypothetical protein